MNARASAILGAAVAVVATSAFCAIFLRPPSPLERLETFPAAVAAMLAEGDFDAVRERLSPQFTFNGLEREIALGVAARERASGRFFPAVAHVETVAFGDDRWNAVIYGVLIQGDPAVTRAPSTRAVRVEAVVERDGDSFRFVEARIP